MNAHSEWERWSRAYRVLVPDYELDREFPMPVRYDWKGVGMEGAFKAGYNVGPSPPMLESLPETIWDQPEWEG